MSVWYNPKTDEIGVWLGPNFRLVPEMSMYLFTCQSAKGWVYIGEL